MTNQMTNQLLTNQTTIQGENKNKIEIEILNSKRLIMANQMETPTETQPNYTNCLTFKQLEELDVFDDIPHKWLKQKHKDDDMRVELIDLECDRDNWSKTLFKFELSWNNYTQQFNTILEYNNSGFHALYIMENLRLCVSCNQHVDTRYADSNDKGHICEDCCIQEEKDEDDESEVEVSEDEESDEEDESEDEKDPRCFRDYANRVEDEPIGYFNICDVNLFEDDYPRSEFNQLKRDLELDGYLEVLIYNEKEEFDEVLGICYSEIYLSIGENKRVTYNYYNTSSPFAMWLCGQDINYYADEQEEEEDIQENVEPSQ